MFCQNILILVQTCVDEMFPLNVMKMFWKYCCIVLQMYSDGFKTCCIYLFSKYSGYCFSKHFDKVARMFWSNVSTKCYENILEIFLHCFTDGIRWLKETVSCLCFQNFLVAFFSKHFDIVAYKLWWNVSTKYYENVLEIFLHYVTDITYNQHCNSNSSYLKLSIKIDNCQDMIA